MPEYLSHPDADPTRSWPTIREAAVQLGVGERTVRRWIKGGHLQWKMLYGRHGREYRVDPRDLARLARELPKKGKATSQPSDAQPSAPPPPPLLTSPVDLDPWRPALEAQAEALMRMTDALRDVARELSGLRQALEHSEDRLAPPPPWWARWWRRRG